MIALVLLRSIFLIGIISCYSIGMFRLINQFFGERYHTYLADELNKKPHLRGILKQQDKVDLTSSSTSLVTPTHQIHLVNLSRTDDDKINIDTCNKIDRFYKIAVTSHLFCTKENAIVVTFNDNDNNNYKNNNVIVNLDVGVGYVNDKNNNNDNIKKIQLKKMLNVNEERRNMNGNCNRDNADFNIENGGKIEIYEHQEWINEGDDSKKYDAEQKCFVNEQRYARR